MAQTLSVYEAQTLITDTLDEVWEAEKPKSQPAYEQFMNVMTMTRGEYADYELAGFGQWDEREELEDVDYDEYSFGDKVTTKPKNWAKAFKVSEEAIEDLADSGGEDRAKLATYAEITRRMRRSQVWTIEQECADLLLNGTSTATEYVLRDGAALFGSHSGLRSGAPSQSNVKTHASLSANEIKTMTTSLDTQLDGAGDYIADDGMNILVISATDDFRAYEILNSAGQVDTDLNNINSLKKTKYKIVVDKYLNVNAAAYSGYFLLREGMHSLRWFWRKKPVFARESSFDDIAMKFRGRFRGVRVAKDWRGTVGDNGS